MHRSVPLLALALVAMFLVRCDSEDDQPRLFATLTGSAEVPAGDPDGSGSAELTLDAGTGEVCFDISVSGVETIQAAHIHEAGPGVPGAIVVPLVDNAGPLNDCVQDVDENLINRILDNPAGFYLNVHNAPYPAGALRGQLTE